MAMHNLQQKIRDLETRYRNDSTAMAGTIGDLTARLGVTPVATGTTDSVGVQNTKTLTIRPAKPGYFHGDKRKDTLAPRTWLHKMRTYFDIATYNPTGRVAFAATYLADQAYAWYMQE